MNILIQNPSPTVIGGESWVLPVPNGKSTNEVKNLAIKAAKLYAETFEIESATYKIQLSIEGTSEEVEDEKNAPRTRKNTGFLRWLLHRYDYNSMINLSELFERVNKKGGFEFKNEQDLLERLKRYTKYFKVTVTAVDRTGETYLRLTKS